MKLLQLKINKWRNLEGVVFDIPPEASLVCLVGENGTGKSNVLELASAVAHRAGIAPGVNMSRGDPFKEPCDLEARVRITATPEKYLPELLPEYVPDEGLQWNGEIHLRANRGADNVLQLSLSAGGFPEPQATHLGQQIVNAVNQRKDTHHLYLDSDRSYPPLDIHGAHYAEALVREWDTAEWKKNRAYLPTRFLYDDWIKYFLALESQQATRHVEAIRSARESKQADPEFNDPFLNFKTSVEKVLPHLKFRGVDIPKKTLTFDSAGTPLMFTRLSGGEREIAFLVGQIDRFKLRTGLLLVDEPELHLNPDLIRAWIAFLRDTVTEGQVWVSTHSIEVVEVAGTESTFVLERDSATRVVKNAALLKQRPVLKMLSAALGSPGFSISNLRFVFVEGERALNERERFHKISGNQADYRFVEGGGCRDVLRKFQTVSELATATEQPLRVGAIVDRDFRSAEVRREIALSGKVLVLPCHEVENLFLHRESLMRLLERAAKNPADADRVVRQAADQYAGAWIQQEAYLRSGLKNEPNEKVRTFAWSTEWDAVIGDPHAFVEKLLVDQAASSDDAERLQKQLLSSLDRYTKQREETTLWKYCMGKQSLESVAKQLGFASAHVLEEHVLQLWASGEVALPAEVQKVRDYIQSL